MPPYWSRVEQCKRLESAEGNQTATKSSCMYTVFDSQIISRNLRNSCNTAKIILVSKIQHLNCNLLQKTLTECLRILGLGTAVFF